MSLAKITWSDILERWPHLGIFVETGTRQGLTSEMMVDFFGATNVWTIEIDEEAYKKVDERWSEHKDYWKINLIQGDSAVVIKTLSFPQPVLWYLDAHWWDNEEAGGGEGPLGFPLWSELQHIRSLPPAKEGTDIVAVDDVHAFGRSVPCGDQRGSRSHIGWETLTIAILDKFMEGWQGEVMGDAYVMWRK